MSKAYMLIHERNGARAGSYLATLNEAKQAAERDRGGIALNWVEHPTAVGGSRGFATAGIPHRGMRGSSRVLTSDHRSTSLMPAHAIIDGGRAPRRSRQSYLGENLEHWGSRRPLGPFSTTPVEHADDSATTQHERPPSLIANATPPGGAVTPALGSRLATEGRHHGRQITKVEAAPRTAEGRRKGPRRGSGAVEARQPESLSESAGKSERLARPNGRMGRLLLGL
jgi:hypothetical protein